MSENEQNEQVEIAAAGETEARDQTAASSDAGAPEGAAAEAPRGGPGGQGRGGRGGRGGGPGQRQEGRGRRGDRESTDGLYEKVVQINRTAKVVKGGRRFSFSVLGVVGDQKGRIGYGLGKANGVPDAIKKALERARANMVTVPITKAKSIPYAVEGKYSGSRLIMRPAAPGTGIIAGGAARAVIEAVGIQDILTKKLGSSNPANVLKATLACLRQLKSPHDIARLRGLSMHELFHGHDAPAPADAAKSEG